MASIVSLTSYKRGNTTQQKKQSLFHRKHLIINKQHKYKVSMLNILNCLVNFGFHLFGYNNDRLKCVKRHSSSLGRILYRACMLKHGVAFTDDGQRILIAGMTAALRGEDWKNKRIAPANIGAAIRRGWETFKEKDGFDSDSHSSSASSSITSICTLHKNDPNRLLLLKPECPGQCNFEDDCEFLPAPNSYHYFPYRPTGPGLGPCSLF